MKTIVLAICLVLTAAVSGFSQASYGSGDTGERVLGSYFSTDVDTVNLSSFNLHINIPLFSLPGRELPLNLSMDYNSKFREERATTDGFGNPLSVWESYAWRKHTGFGRLVSARNQTGSGTTSIDIGGTHYSSYINWNLVFTWVDSNGTKNTFSNPVTQYCTSSSPSPCDNPNPTDATIYDGRTINSTGSEFMKLETSNYFSNGSNPAVIYLKNGNQMRFGPMSADKTELRTTNGEQLRAIPEPGHERRTEASSSVDVEPLRVCVE